MLQTRVVETAIDLKGDSYIFSDKEVSGWELGGHTVTDLFFSDKCPPDMMASCDELKDRDFNLKPGQIRFFRSDIPPTKPLYDQLSPEEKPKNFKELYNHSTSTVDYIIVLRGEIVLIVGNKEVTLKAGDTVVQRGASHAWHNYTQEMATIMGIMIGVSLPKQFKRIDTIQPE